jgi:hypothetical protein
MQCIDASTAAMMVDRAQSVLKAISDFASRNPGHQLIIAQLYFWHEKMGGCAAAQASESPQASPCFCTVVLLGLC